jgi:hypothetical protein
MLSRIVAQRAVPRLRLVRAYATPVEFKQPKNDPQLGDYPQIPAISVQRRPAKGWWNVQERRNFGETVGLLFVTGMMKNVFLKKLAFYSIFVLKPIAPGAARNPFDLVPRRLQHLAK